jgi:plasmid maintenance system killer protein
MNSIPHLFAAFALIAGACPALAQSLPNYKCKIERVARSDDSEPKLLELQRKQYLGREFFVDRRTGEMSGALKNAYITRPDVIDPGSAETSFKVVTSLRRNQGAGPGSNLYSLVVNEYKNAQRKPFVFMENDETFFGHCVHT